MTVATNALLEGRGARTVLIATEGFTDLIALGRQTRAELYRLCAARPAPLVADELRFGAPERMAPDGPLRELERGRRRRARRACRRLRCPRRSPWCCCTPTDTRSTSACSARCCPKRCPTRTCRCRTRWSAPSANTSARPPPRSTRRCRRCSPATCAASSTAPREADLPEPAIMQSNGGLIDLDAAAGHAAWTVLSGPAGGAAGAAFVARAAGPPDALCFDMGGTSCDVCVIEDGAVQERGSGEIAGRPLALPMLAIHTVGAGGGSIAWRDAGGALRVGPRSAGADPGPACYGRGGTEPTVTDANLVLGLLASDAPLAGGVELDIDAARDAVGTLAAELGLDLLDCAEGIRRVAGAEMIRALRVVTVQRGIDPRRFALLPFGGAGPLHATADRRRAGDRARSCARGPQACLRPLGLVVSAAPPRRPAQRAAGRRRSDRRGGRNRRGRARGARAQRARRGRRRAERHLRAALPRAGVRAGRRRRRPSRSPSSCARRSRPSTRIATATATPSRRSSWSRSA